jgi:ATP-dependent exoDNAse (exonuclease V) alpha subunit
MTGAERSWASRYEIDDVVRYTRGSKAIGIEAAAYASVVAINPAANQLTVEESNQELATYDPRRLTGVSVYQEIDRQFSVGDRIQFTAPDRSLGVANRELGMIENIVVGGQILLRLEDGRAVQFCAAEHPPFDHGYAVTSHSSQGLTADRVLINIDTNTHPQLLNSRFAYVAVSRARLEVEIYTDNSATLVHLTKPIGGKRMCRGFREWAFRSSDVSCRLQLPVPNKLAVRCLYQAVDQDGRPILRSRSSKRRSL